MSEKCPKCGAGRAMSPTGLRVYECGSRSRGDGTQFETSAICTDSQLAQKDRELEQSRQREAQALAVAARVKEWAARPRTIDAGASLESVIANIETILVALEYLDTILADAPKVLAVVDGWAGCECLWDDPDGEYGLHIPDTPDEEEPSTPVRVIVLGRDESEG